MANGLSLFGAVRNAATVKAMSSVDNRGGGGWFPFVREPYTGAWQRNDEWCAETVLANSTVFACVTLIAADIGKMPVNLTRRTDQDIWVDTSSPKYSPVLRKPNRYQNHIQFKESWITSKLTRGNTYGLKERDRNGNVVAIYILDTTYVSVLVADDGSVYYSLNADKLNGLETGGLVVPASEIIHDRMNCLFHPLMGLSPLFASGLAAWQAIKIQKDSTRFFGNSATPGGVLTAPGAIATETAQRLKAHWDANYTGENAGKVAVLGDGLKFEAMRMTAVDSQMVEQLRWTAEQICSTFHVPAYKVGVGSMPTNNNIEALTKDYYSQCLQSLIEAMELCLDEGLEIPEGLGVELDLMALFRMDSETQVRTLGEAVKSSIMAPNEARKRLNIAPAIGGDSPMIQQQNYSLAAIHERDTASTDGIADVQGTAMNGAQVTSLQGLITAAADGTIPPSTISAVIAAAFPALTQAQISAMIGPIGTPEPSSAEDQQLEDQARMFGLLIQKELASADYA